MTVSFFLCFLFQCGILSWIYRPNISVSAQSKHSARPIVWYRTMSLGCGNDISCGFAHDVYDVQWTVRLIGDHDRPLSSFRLHLQLPPQHLAYSYSNASAYRLLAAYKV